MLANVIGSYIDSLSEREFDSPFIALLYLHGFHDIHFLHGSFEFGKDFIAKRTEGQQEKQYAFQTKSGNITLGIWNEARGQVDMLRTDSKAHPSFDPSLPREAIFVTTGRLAGAASLAAQGYKDHLATLKELSFSVWDREDLVKLLVDAPTSLANSSAAFLAMLGTTKSDLTFDRLEEYSRHWIRPAGGAESLRDTIEMSVIASHCRKEDRIDLACFLTLMSLRSTLATEHGQIPMSKAGAVAYSTAKESFKAYATTLWHSCKSRFLIKDSMFDEAPSVTLISYPVRCSSILEILGMLALLDPTRKVAEDIAKYISLFIACNAGAQHPISDRWAVSLIPASLLLVKLGKASEVETWLRSCVIWIANHYETNSLGLAAPHSKAQEEAVRLLGDAFEFVKEERRRDSYLATILLDLCSIIRLSTLYEDALNEFLAVGIFFPVLRFGDNRAQYCLHLQGNLLEPNASYRDSLDCVDWLPVSAHHVSSAAYYPERVDGLWAHLAVSSVTRDRYLPHIWEKVVDSVEG